MMPYIPDISEMNDAAWDEISKTNIWILDALRRTSSKRCTPKQVWNDSKVWC